ncbi:uncharacterized protein LOC134710571 [Mytilus trossulus]|uniref:uncharacterized protein LOC134710571 n=1 Tax=Mytilus trossulus TaxID=6551 RepID=UPI0030062E61
MTMQYETFSISDELKELEAEVEVSMRAGKTMKNAGGVFKDTGLNYKLNGAIGKEMKKEERREKREKMEEEKRQKKLDREEEMIIKKYTKRIEMIMERYNKADKVQQKKDKKRKKQVEKHEKKTQKMLEKEKKKMETECDKDGKKNTVLSSIQAFFGCFSCLNRQEKADV